MWNKPKYGNKRTTHAGMSFASKAEADCYDYLMLRLKAGEINAITQQDHVYLTDARIDYIADFCFEDLKTGTLAWAEMKGFETPVWRIKRRLWMYYGPGRLEVYKSNSRGVYLHETILPDR